MLSATVNVSIIVNYCRLQGDHKQLRDQVALYRMEALMTAALQCANPDGWCGWAIPAQPGRMVGASAVIVKACTNCSTGATADKYLLAAKRSSAIVPGTGSLDVVGPIYAAKTGGGLIAVFTMRVTPDAAQPDAQTNYIAAHGSVDASDTLQPHTDQMAVAGTLSLASGTSSSDSSSNPTVDKATTAHGVLMTVAWAVILPISVAIAFSMRKTWGPRTWFQIHRALGVIAFVCILAGFALGVYLWVTGGPDLPDILKAHVSIGVITTAFAILQALALVARPKPDAKYRGLWNHYHHSVGRIVVLLAFANALIGFYLGGLGWGWYLGLALIWCFIWSVAAVKAFYDRLREERCTFIKKGGMQTNGATEMSANPGNGAYSNMA
ncbi:g8524 [Coccomyxa elongata]